MFIKKRFFRTIESIIFKTLSLFSKLKNKKLLRAINSAQYKNQFNRKYLLSNNSEIKYLVKTGDEIAKYLYINNSWNFHVLKKACRLLKKKRSISTLINIGAHVGSTCIPAIKSNLFKQVIAFEPFPINFKLLMTNIFLNSLEKNIEAHNVALSNKRKKLFIKQFGVNSGDCRILKKKEKNSHIIKCHILDEYTQKYNKNNSIIFMYAQGHEPEIFLGAKKTILKKIPIITEFMPSLFNTSWIKKMSYLIKNYKFFYDLKKNEPKKNFSVTELENLKNEYIVNNNYTDILIFN